ncbi:glycoside hydrolase family 3 N-terminal domain-containing protein [Sedimentibacter sp.]|uniref:glycoside hydrolase family 3 N-terminal domain-containing protein n=1 Tax=Sedimentibacter sp. TaxID=1960295 RepID=UPI0028A8B7D3|nr:glycoside hydrolase family 3 N-terminal domain-containing protein [Sedimentibacter sp.]
MKNLFIYLLIFLLTGCTSIEQPKNPDKNNGSPPPVEEPGAPAEPEIPEEPEDNSLFHEYDEQAEKLLLGMTTEEKIGQIFLVRYPEEKQLDLYLSMNPGGFIMFGKDFTGKSKNEVIDNIDYCQISTTVPMIIAVDEEGGTVVRVSSNPLLSDERFKSPQELYEIGGFNEIERDTVEKSKLLSELGINLNLAPVADISVDKTDFIYQRSFGKNAEETAKYIKTVVEAMKKQGISSSLKHFPGYGNNADTHTGSATDTRPYQQFINNDFIPFKAGIESGAESILISHNIIESIDPELPASLSKKVIDILRYDMEFTGIIMTDDLSMGAISELRTELSPEAAAVSAGNDMLIVTDFENSFQTLLNAINSGEIHMDRIDESVLRILKWKYYLSLFK